MFEVKITGLKAKVTNSELLTTGTVGAQVKFTFSDDWADKTKTAVFKRCGKVIDVLESEWGEDNAVTIPPEMTEKAGQLVGVGIYGRNTDGKKVTPTIYAPLGVVAIGADPSGDESTDPTLPVFSQIQAELSRAVKVDPQDFTDEEKAQARENIHAMPLYGDAVQGNETLFIKNAGGMYESAIDIDMEVNRRRRLHQIGGIGYVTTMYEADDPTKVASQAIVHANSISVGDRRYSPVQECQLLKDGITTTRNTPLYLGKTSSHVDLVSHQLKNVKDPTDDQDAATKKYVDDKAVEFAPTSIMDGYTASPVEKLKAPPFPAYYTPIQRFDTIDDLNIVFNLGLWTFVINADTADGYLAGLLKIPNMVFPIIMEPRTPDSGGSSVIKYRYYVTLKNQEIWQVDLVKTTSSPSYIYNNGTTPVFIPRRVLEIDETETSDTHVVTTTSIGERNAQKPIVTTLPDWFHIPISWGDQMGGIFSIDELRPSGEVITLWVDDGAEDDAAKLGFNLEGEFILPLSFGAGVVGAQGIAVAGDSTKIAFPFSANILNDIDTGVLGLFYGHPPYIIGKDAACSIPYEKNGQLHVNRLTLLRTDNDSYVSVWQVHEDTLYTETITATGNNTDGWTFTGELTGDISIGGLPAYNSAGSILFIQGYGRFYPEGHSNGAGECTWVSVVHAASKKQTDGTFSYTNYCYVMTTQARAGSATLSKVTWAGTAIETV